MSSTRHTSHGFTLLELLVAITVFAIMSVMAYGGLSNVISNSDASKQALSRLQEVQQSMRHIERDFSQIVERGIRDELGAQQAFIIASDADDSIIEFTRGGRRNPAKRLRSNLLRVAYRIEEGKLIRMHWPQLDRVQGMLAIETELLSGIDSAGTRFLGTDGEWYDQWPPLNSQNPAFSGPLDLSAIEYSMELSDWGRINRLFKVRS